MYVSKIFPRSGYWIYIEIVSHLSTKCHIYRILQYLQIDSLVILFNHKNWRVLGDFITTGLNVRYESMLCEIVNILNVCDFALRFGQWVTFNFLLFIFARRGTLFPSGNPAAMDTANILYIIKFFISPGWTLSSYEVLSHSWPI